MAVWVAGERRSSRSARLREAAVAYIAQLKAAQDQGVALPELSPQLARLLEEDDVTGTPAS
ncbi:hypothetical protein SF12_17105 [Streptomyces sp. MBRL 601]|nr:hypothetical protein SF12_17105 [Streptomyces sp. MBRL 601]